jgi:hypothetical protein
LSRPTIVAAVASYFAAPTPAGEWFLEVQRTGPAGPPGGRVTLNGKVVVIDIEAYDTQVPGGPPWHTASASVRVVAGWLPEDVPAKALTPYSAEERRETGAEDEATPWPGLCLDARVAILKEGLPLPQEIGFELRSRAERPLPGLVGGLRRSPDGRSRSYRIPAERPAGPRTVETGQ